MPRSSSVRRGARPPGRDRMPSRRASVAASDAGSSACHVRRAQRIIRAAGPAIRRATRTRAARTAGAPARCPRTRRGTPMPGDAPPAAVSAWRVARPAQRPAAERRPGADRRDVRQAVERRRLRGRGGLPVHARRARARSAGRRASPAGRRRATGARPRCVERLREHEGEVVEVSGLASAAVAIAWTRDPRRELRVGRTGGSGPGRRAPSRGRRPTSWNPLAQQPRREVRAASRGPATARRAAGDRAAGEQRERLGEAAVERGGLRRASGRLTSGSRTAPGRRGHRGRTRRRGRAPRGAGSNGRCVSWRSRASIVTSSMASWRITTEL